MAAIKQYLQVMLYFSIHDLMFVDNISQDGVCRATNFPIPSCIHLFYIKHKSYHVILLCASCQGHVVTPLFPQIALYPWPCEALLGNIQVMSKVTANKLQVSR